MTFLYLNSDRMGVGNDELGRKLLRSFLKHLADSDIQIDAIGCVNSGIYLTTEGSTVLESLKLLEARGARIATCGTCLEYHDRKDKLLIGEIGSMPMTVHIMAEADRVIKPC